MPSCPWRKVRVFFVLIHINLPYIFNLMSLFFFFSLYVYYHVFTLLRPSCLSPSFFVNGLAVESVTDPYKLLCTTFPVWVAHIWINKGCWLSHGVPCDCCNSPVCPQGGAISQVMRALSSKTYSSVRVFAAWKWEAVNISSALWLWANV